MLTTDARDSSMAPVAALGSASSGFQAWKQGMREQIGFFSQAIPAARNESSFYWPIVDKAERQPSLRETVRSGMDRLKGGRSNELWFVQHAECLWETRALLEDPGSQFSFDAAIVLRLVGHRRYFYPNTLHQGTYLEVLGSSPFRSNSLPEDYLGLPLVNYDLRVDTDSGPVRVQVLAAQGWDQVQCLYSQYLVRFGQTDFSPRRGETVFDCGSCIGEISTLFGTLVGPSGSVHMFDPVPLHLRYCMLQAQSNRILDKVLIPVQMAVSDRSSVQAGSTADAHRITPGGLAIDDFSSIALDDYVGRQGIERVDFIKMDIEGAECAALMGAAETLRKHKPRLAISVYHKWDDLWVIPDVLRSINPEYRLHFAHHSPLSWESVLYAC